MRNFMLTIFLALFLGSVVTDPPHPVPGLYSIANRVSAPNGDKLALTYKPGQAAATVAPLNLKPPPPQIWKISDLNPDGTQSITSAADSSIQPTTAKGFVVLVENPGSTWAIIRNITSGYHIIQDPARFLVWSIYRPVNGSIIYIEEATGSQKQDWVFESVGL